MKIWIRTALAGILTGLLLPACAYAAEVQADSTAMSNQAVEGSFLEVQQGGTSEKDPEEAALQKNLEADLELDLEKLELTEISEQTESVEQAESADHTESVEQTENTDQAENMAQTEGTEQDHLYLEETKIVKNGLLKVAAPVLEKETGITTEKEVTSLSELQEELKKSGSARLGASILIPYGETLNLAERNSIETGEYGLLIAGELSLTRETALSGIGIDRPVAEVLSGGVLRIRETDWVDAPTVVATGDTGCALLLRQGSEYIRAHSSIVRISAEGVGATALLSEIPLDLKGHYITSGGRGIVSSEEVRLFLCQITAVQATITAPNTELDTCALSSLPTGSYTEVRRKISRISAKKPVLPMGEPLEDYWQNPMYVQALLSAEGTEGISLPMMITLELSEVDTSAIGTYPVKIYPPEWLAGFHLIPDGLVLFSFEIQDIRIPHFVETMSAGGIYTIDYEYMAENLENLIVWRSDDEGRHWYDATEDIIMEQGGTRLTLIFTEKEAHPVCLVLEAKGVGESPILRITWEDYTMLCMYGGDRTGLDRGKGELPLGSHRSSESEEGLSARRVDKPVKEADGQVALQRYAIPFLLSMIPKLSSAEAAETDVVLAKPDKALPSPSEALSDAPVVSDVVPEVRTMEVSGKQLADWIAVNPQYVSFLEGEFRVAVPTAALTELGLAAEDVFTIAVSPLEAGTLSVHFWVNEAEVALPLTEPFLLSLPWDTGEIEAEDEHGVSVPAVWDEETDQVTFSFEQAGTFRVAVTEEWASEEAPESKEVFVPNRQERLTAKKSMFTVGVLMLAGAGVAVGCLAGCFYRNRGKRP